jgi:hypothetical protein
MFGNLFQTVTVYVVFGCPKNCVLDLLLDLLGPPIASGHPLLYAFSIQKFKLLWFLVVLGVVEPCFGPSFGPIAFGPLVCAFSIQKFKNLFQKWYIDTKVTSATFSK